MLYLYDVTTRRQDRRPLPFERPRSCPLPTTLLDLDACIICPLPTTMWTYNLRREMTLAPWRPPRGQSTG